MYNTIGVDTMASKGVLARIEAEKGVLPPKQIALAAYILNNYKEVSFMKSKDLAKAAGVGESTVIRFAMSLGYSGYVTFQNSLQEIVKQDISTLDSFAQLKSINEETIFHKVFATEVDIMNQTIKGIAPERFDEAVELLSSKETLVIIGLQGSRCLAEYAGYTFNKIRPNVRVFTEYVEATNSFIRDCHRETVAMIFTFRRYPRKTILAATELSKIGIPIVGFTDSILSPLSKLSEVSFVVPSRVVSFVDNLAAVMALLNALSYATAYRNQRRTRKCLERFEEHARENQIFLKWTALSRSSLASLPALPPEK